MSITAQFGLTLCTAVAVCFAAWIDVRTRRIPNWLTLSTLLANLALHAVSGGWSEMALALLAALLAGSIFAVFFLAGGMGGGDVKLAAAVSAGIGLSGLPCLLVFTALCGGVMAVVVALRHGRLRQTLLQAATIVSHHGRAGLQPHPELNVRNPQALHLPYAVAIAAGTLLAMHTLGMWR